MGLKADLPPQYAGHPEFEAAKVAIEQELRQARMEALVKYREQLQQNPRANVPEKYASEQEFRDLRTAAMHNAEIAAAAAAKAQARVQALAQYRNQLALDPFLNPPQGYEYDHEFLAIQAAAPQQRVQNYPTIIEDLRVFLETYSDHADAKGKIPYSQYYGADSGRAGIAKHRSLESLGVLNVVEQVIADLEMGLISIDMYPQLREQIVRITTIKRRAGMDTPANALLARFKVVVP